MPEVDLNTKLFKSFDILGPQDRVPACTLVGCLIKELNRRQDGSSAPTSWCIFKKHPLFKIWVKKLQDRRPRLNSSDFYVNVTN